jgi:hypothetical protein
LSSEAFAPKESGPSTPNRRRRRHFPCRHRAPPPSIAPPSDLPGHRRARHRVQGEPPPRSPLLSVLSVPPTSASGRQPEPGRALSCPARGKTWPWACSADVVAEVAPGPSVSQYG